VKFGDSLESFSLLNFLLGFFIMINSFQQNSISNFNLSRSNQNIKLFVFYSGGVKIVMRKASELLPCKKATGFQ